MVRNGRSPLFDEQTHLIDNGLACCLHPIGAQDGVDVVGADSVQVNEVKGRVGTRGRLQAPNGFEVATLGEERPAVKRKEKERKRFRIQWEG